ncbi:ankyrin unc44 [Colletotrichum truncatum]|uniref:Ankyrin unc44 n=1 Tax=Colletotrichum truncatum TaxID=5467 RepID=A0ACC3YEL0_COLTU|nr:ankyrin unc44 [Colletotrichum truncatum]KAF6783274.1 ankyrin unc44 [Colletotrichum truncatum]
MDASPKRDWSQALAEVQERTAASYHSVLRYHANDRNHVGTVKLTLRLLCGTLHSLSLLVEEFTAHGKGWMHFQKINPDFNLLDELSTTLENLNQQMGHESLDQNVLKHLQRLLGVFTTAAATDNYFALVIALSNSTSRIPPSNHFVPKESDRANGQNGSTEESAQYSFDAAETCVSNLLDPIHNRKPDSCFSFRNYAAQRDAMHPSYGESALRLPNIAEKHWESALQPFEVPDSHEIKIIQADLKRLFHPKKTANFEQWILEYARKQWPERFDTTSRALSMQPLSRLMSVVFDPSFRTLHVAAALGLPSLCQWLISEEQKGIVRQSSPIGVSFYCALLGPNALLGRVDDPVQLLVDMRPSSHQEKTLQLLLDAGALRHLETTGIGPSKDEHVSLATLSFLVCHNLRAPQLFLNILESGVNFDERFVQLFEGDNSILKHWPSILSQISRPFLESVLPAILDKSVIGYDSYEDMSSLARGIYDIIDHYDEESTWIEPTTRKLDVSDNTYDFMVREAVQEGDVAIVRRLIQDSRWDPDIFITGKRTVSTSAGGTSLPPTPLKGTSLLHYAVESNGLPLVRIILKSRKDVNVHVRNNNDQTPLMLSESPEIFKLLHDYGARTTDTDDVGRNVWHFAAANSDIDLIDCLVENDENMDENLRGLMLGGQTPIAQGILYPFKQMRKEPKSTIRPPISALHMLKVCKRDPAYLQSTIPLLFLAAEWGSEELASSLIDFGADAAFVDDKGQSALHFLNVSATEGLILALQKACHAPVLNKEGMTPAETIFAAFNETAKLGRFPDKPLNHPANSRSLLASAYELLLTTETLASCDSTGAGLWERFAQKVICQWGPQWRTESTASASLRTAVNCLINAGAVASYEQENNQSGLIPVLEGWTKTSLDRVSAASWIGDILELIFHASSRRYEFSDSPEAVKYLKLAIRQGNHVIVQDLVGMKVSLHVRHDGVSAMELACQVYNGCDETMFNTLLDHADPSKLNDTDPSGVGLLHKLIDGMVLDRDRKLEALLRRGCDPNPPPGIGKDPVLVSYVKERQIDAALTLLHFGADPSATNSFGMDAAIAAASRGSLRILEEIRHCKPGFDWGRKCVSHFAIWGATGMDRTTTMRDCTALHLAAHNGHEAVLQLYIKDLGLDIESATVDELWRPLHSAVVGGFASCVRTLLEHGADPAARDYQGCTPLTVAVHNNRIEATRVLLDLGLKNNSHMDIAEPFVRAVVTGRKDIIRLFKPYLMTIVPGPPNGLGVPNTSPKVVGVVLENLIAGGNMDDCAKVLDLVEPSARDSIRLACGKCSPMVLALKLQHFHISRLFIELGMTSHFVGGHCFRHIGGFFPGMSGQLFEPTALHYAINRLKSEISTDEKAVVTQLQDLSDWTQYSLSPMHTAARREDDVGARLIVDHIREHPERYIRLLREPRRWPQPNSSVLDNREIIAKQTDDDTPSTSDGIIRQIVNQRVASHDHSAYEKGTTPLLTAISNSFLETTRFLVEHGADVNMPHENNATTPLHEAVSNDFVEGARYLLEKGANHNLRDSQSYTPLALAVVLGHFEMAQLLVDHGANLEVYDSDGVGLLSICGEKAMHPEMFVWLLSLGLDPYKPDKSGYTPVHDTILSNGLPGIVFNYGFDFSRVSEIRKGLLSLIIEFVQGKANGVLIRLLKRLPKEKKLEMVNSIPTAFISPLCNAVVQDEMGCLHTLLAHGADVDVEGSVEGSALMVACAIGRFDAVRVLVYRGAKIAYDTVLADGCRVFRSALAYAEPFPEIVRWLLVERHTSQRRLEFCTDGSAGLEEVVMPWSGIHVAGYELVGAGAHGVRKREESSLDFAERLDEIRRSLRGMSVRVLNLD